MLFGFALVSEYDGLLKRLIDLGIKYFLHFGGLEDDIVHILVEELLRVNIEVIMFLALAEELLLEPVAALVQVFADFEVLRAQVIERGGASLEMILQHSQAVIFINYRKLVYSANHITHFLFRMNPIGFS